MTSRGPQPRARARRAAAADVLVVFALALLLVVVGGAAAQQEPLPNVAAANVVVTSPGGHRADAALAALESKLQEPVAVHRGCATPHPTPEQLSASSEAVQALRARRVAGGQGASASAFKDSLVDKPPTVVQTYFHVVYPVARASDLVKKFPNNTYGGDDYIARQIATLNAGYKGTGFQFALAGTTRTFNPQWANAGYGSSQADAMFRKLRQGGYDALNFFVVFPGGGLLGYATFPLDKQSPASMRRLDGVVLHYNTLPSRPGEPEPWAYSRGETAVHEAGHWFSLLHTFQGGCQQEEGGDQVADTPPEEQPTFGCAAKPVDTCPDSPGVDSTSNYMSYSDDVCLTYFTPGQIERMNASFDALRRGVKVQQQQRGMM